MRRLLILAFLFFCLVGIAVGYLYWPRVQTTFKNVAKPSQQEELAEQAQAKQLLSDGKPIEALKIIKKYDSFINSNTPEGKAWIDLLLTASEQTKNIQQLMIVYEYYPDAFENHEEGVLLVEQGLLASGRGKDFDDVRKTWKGKEQNLPTWFILDGDRLLLDGKRDEATTYFKSKTFQGTQDTNRLLRLAWLAVNQDPKASWTYLSEAFEKDPHNPFIRIYRARLLEAAGKTPLALSEYIGAVQTSPNLIGLRDQLAEFFRRYRQYPQAIQIWYESFSLPDSDFMWVKAWFWSHVTIPFKFDWKSAPIPEGPLKPLVEYLLALPKDKFWDEKEFLKIPNYNSFLKADQSTFWLRILQNLKDGKEKEALELLEFNVFTKNSWNPDLELALQRILNYRVRGSLGIVNPQTKQKMEQMNLETNFSPERQINVRSSFFTQVEELSQKSSDNKSGQPFEIPADIKALIDSKEVFSSTFLAAGWLEAALELNTLKVIPDNFPDWVPYGLTQAFRYNRSEQAALEFATSQKQTPSLDLLIAELLIIGGNTEAGIDKLKPLINKDDDIGQRATWMLAIIEMDKKNFDKAKEIVKANPKFAQSMIGQETLARIALLEGNMATADAIYQSIEANSAEAKSYLARKAFADKNWKKAKQLTEELLLQYPNNMLIRQNLQKIIEEEMKENQANSPSTSNTTIPDKTPAKELQESKQGS